MESEVSYFAKSILAILVILLNILWTICTSPPNGSAAEVSSKTRAGDRVGLSILPRAASIYAISAVFAYAIGFYHAILILYYPHPPPSICPQAPGFAQFASRVIFTWNGRLAIILGLACLVAGPIRIASFRNLGPNFTFTLKEPNHLVTTGIHAYIQHPSYVGVLLIIECMMLIYVRFDGLLACWLPPGWIEAWKWTQPWVVGLLSLVFGFATWTRILDEEVMLKSWFGREWEDWHRRTARFIPGII